MGEQETAARNFFEAGGKYRLAEAVKQLMGRQSLEDITVKEITGEAGVSRQTFYRHFLDKYDLVNWYFDELLANSFREMGYGRTIYEGLVRKFRYIQAEKVFFRAAFQSVQQNNLKDHDFRKIYGFYQDLYRKKTGKDLDRAVLALLEMYCQASIYMTVKWVSRGTRDAAPEELAELMLQAMPPALIDKFTACDLLR
ncbi:TetR/AcrR family transcriptional regulator C-terminal domain-containing protein [Acidaminococcus fermentans]|uniref:TetR/AcrR family transcriptional regulator C-terminal domain-containing protein n=1 Tax=Acidaminococcus fermentans TaxID=905 RepID=UPI002E78E94B|nr:TetR/AcrR family transcriptional regulator C-terminal domain-containing protein [Acidaminococcus fermentans]MEE1597601.1 TetR/AcrR family transcriptional regulator C-terminal domain-containing protein [Acidaminococcus fermentans]MEE4121863.1 TetR/AcrR family transcriptional regulator C-terminal domain-containing protein [Acidaminococcus fermentans]